MTQIGLVQRLKSEMAIIQDEILSGDIDRECATVPCMYDLKDTPKITRECATVPCMYDLKDTPKITRECATVPCMYDLREN